jgi:hypothetical protein
MNMGRIFRTRISSATLLITAIIVTTVFSCVHEPFPSPGGDPDPGNGEPVATDTVNFNIITEECDPGTIYFNTQVLPIFISNCAISGCHDAASHKDGIVTTNYLNIMKGMKAGDLNDSEYYKALIAADSEDLMPRKPGTERGYSLPADQINTIKNWILQGAKNTICNGCDTTSYTFIGKIKSIIDLNCATSTACHGSGSKYGPITTYDQLKAMVDNDLIQKRVIVYKTMPPAAPLVDCDRLLIKKWIDDGGLNN